MTFKKSNVDQKNLNYCECANHNLNRIDWAKFKIFMIEQNTVIINLHVYLSVLIKLYVI